jgi:hypothetical protein
MNKGLGDTIASMTNKLGIRSCDGCKKRQKWLNSKVQYNRNNNLHILANALTKSKQGFNI